MGDNSRLEVYSQPVCLKLSDLGVQQLTHFDVERQLGGIPGF